MIINPIILSFGMLFFFSGVLLLIKQLKKRNHDTASVMAEVVSYFCSIHHDSDGESVAYHPVIRYYAMGRWYEQKSDVGSGRKKYNTGERIEILYDPEHPEDFIIARDKSTYVASGICMVIGIGICIFAFLPK